MTRERERESGSDVYRRIFDVVRRIPRGRVATYGQVAAYAGIPRGARLVGWALRASPAGCPWWRVINAQGRISLTGLPGEEQRRLLVKERVPFDAGERIALKRFLWLPEDV